MTYKHKYMKTKVTFSLNDITNQNLISSATNHGIDR